MKIIESYFHILNQIKLITNDKIESEAETALIFSSRLFKEYFGRRLERDLKRMVDARTKESNEATGGKFQV